MLKSTIRSLLLAAMTCTFASFAIADDDVGNCKMKCHEKAKEQRGACRDERRACIAKHFDEKIKEIEAKGGVKAERKQKWISKLTERVEMAKAAQEDSAEMVELLSANLEKVKALKEKEGKK